MCQDHEVFAVYQYMFSKLSKNWNMFEVRILANPSGKPFIIHFPSSFDKEKYRVPYISLGSQFSASSLMHSMSSASTLSWSVSPEKARDSAFSTKEDTAFAPASEASR